MNYIEWAKALAKILNPWYVVAIYIRDEGFTLSIESTVNGYQLIYLPGHSSFDSAIKHAGVSFYNRTLGDHYDEEFKVMFIKAAKLCEEFK